MLAISNLTHASIESPNKREIQKSGLPNISQKWSKCKRRNDEIFSFSFGDSDRALLVAYFLLLHPRACFLLMLRGTDHIKVDPDDHIWKLGAANVKG